MPRRRRASIQSRAITYSLDNVTRAGHGSPLGPTTFHDPLPVLVEKAGPGRNARSPSLSNGTTMKTVYVPKPMPSPTDRYKTSLCYSYDGVHMEQVRPSLDRFADDTSMLGFRYLHSRYKTWFRILWSLLLIFFFGLTFYQVGERISYYFISNPLKTTRDYNSPSYVSFPKVVVCNKMQIKASKIAKVAPRLLSALSEVYDDEQRHTNNETVEQILKDFDSINAFNFFVNVKQNVEDLFVGCRFGKSRNCVDQVRPVLTPNGHCFLVHLNTSVTRPGPESTLQLLLNLETYEAVPGWQPEPGLVLAMSDAEVSFVNPFQEGMHLEAGKSVTIPINDVRKLHRHYSQCGSDHTRQNVFREPEYSRSACMWLAKVRDISNRCHCEPAMSPQRSSLFANEVTLRQLVNAVESEEKAELLAERAGRRNCTISEEVFCAQRIMGDSLDNDHLAESSGCENDCTDVSFTTIVFGNELHTSDIAHFIPADWEEEKEKRLSQFQFALDHLPKSRVPLIRRIQRIADDAQNFLERSREVFGRAVDSTSDVPCFEERTGSFEADVDAFHSRESVWDGLKVFLEAEFGVRFEAALKLLNLELHANAVLRDDFDSSEKSEEHYLTLSTRALYGLRLFENLVTGAPHQVAGLSAIDQPEQFAVLAHLRRFLRQLQNCLVKLQFREPEEARNSTRPCRRLLLEYYDMLYEARTISKVMSKEMVKGFSAGVTGLVGVLQKLDLNDRGSIFRMKDYNVDLKAFRKFYREGGQGHAHLLDLLRYRKFIQVEAVEYVKSTLRELEKVSDYRQNISRSLGLNYTSMTFSPPEFHRDLAKCLAELAPQLETLKKSPMIRAELMSRINHEVTVAQSYSPGPEYDKVNLMLLKVYFAHFKEEVIVQERSYNVFLLLAEIGGTIGLYVGAALLSLVETFVFFFEKNTIKFPLLKDTIPT